MVAASRRLAGHAHRTPVRRSATADRMLGAEVFFKCENDQRMGAFKFRGAFNALSAMGPARQAAGVVTFSSGNHGQAVALSARLLGLRAVVLMPNDAPQAKVGAALGYLDGTPGEIMLYDRYTQDREQLTQQLALERGMALIPPYDHPDIIAGQGTAAQELFEDVGALDALFVCVGGGGLLAGCALAAKALSPGCKLYGVEPEAGNDGQQSFRSGEIVHIPTPRTIADGAQAQHLGQLTFALIRQHVDDMLTATDAQLVETMRFYAERMKMVVEPTGCLSFAAACHAGLDLRGQRVGVIVSGGNVAMTRLAELLA